jgi:hypothetical protein
MADNIEGLVKFESYSELKPVTQKFDKVVVLNMKDGSRYYLANQDELAKYSNRPDVESFMFFYDGDEAPQQADAGMEAADAGQATVATVSVPSVPVASPSHPPQGGVEALPMLMGAIAGAVSSAGTPALTNLAKSLLKKQMKGKKAEEKNNEVTDCKTHQISTNAKFASISSRVSALESGGSKLDLPSSDDLEELVERVEKLEKAAKVKKKTKK